MKFNYQAIKNNGIKNNCGKHIQTDAKILCKQSNNLASFILNWISRTRSIRMTLGLGSKGQRYALLYMLDDGVELACAEVDFEYIDPLYPDLESVTYSISGVAQDERSFLFNENWFADRDLRLGVEWDCDFCENVVGIEDALEIAMSYVIADVGEAYFSFYDQHALSYLEFSNVSRSKEDQYVSLGLNFVDYKWRMGWGEQFVVSGG